MSTYPTKRDGWLLAILWAAAGALIFALVQLLREPQDPERTLVAPHLKLRGDRLVHKDS